MYKKKLTLAIDDELIKLAKDDGLNISMFLEDALALRFNLKRKTSSWDNVSDVYSKRTEE